MTVYSDVNDSPLDSTQIVVNTQSVFQALDNLFNTRPRERLFRSTLGVRLEELLFEPVNDVTAASIYAVVIDAIAEAEPRVILDNSQSSVTPFHEQGRYDVVMVFSILGFEDEQRFEGSIPAGTRN
ncbi:hypothetical protein GR11A_00126 [Vibrio phage vB_VcorM_GR11A]|nr:hypothetical protein GR11A_00126 [Vibrio phage vB_VcorM_GR11A]